MMYDKRVVRGSTHAAMVIPAGAYPDTLFQGKKGGTQGKGGAGNNMQVRKYPYHDFHVLESLNS